MAALPAEKARERKKPIGSIGSLGRSSQATKAAMSTAPRTNDPTTSGLPQPASLPRTRAHTKPSTPPVTRARPRRSRLVSVPRLSRIFVSTSGTVTAPMGTLIQKIHCHARPWTTAPPISGPLATARPVMALNIPIAAPRFSGGKAALNSARPSGTRSAEPAPCRARAAMRTPTVGASAHAAEAAGGNEDPDVRRRRARGRSRREQRHAYGVEVAPPVAVAERRPGHQQHREAQVVGVDGPLELLDGGAEGEADRAQRGGHPQRVKRRHQRADSGQHDDPAGHALRVRS